MIVIVSEPHIHPDSRIVVVDSCPSNFSICMVKCYPNSISVSYVGLHPSKFCDLYEWLAPLAHIQIPCLLLMVGTHPDSLVMTAVKMI